MKYCSLTDKGLVRERNEDNFSTIENVNSDILFFVCDGIGGNNAGNIASKETVDIINSLFKKAPRFKSTKDIINFINTAINEANENLLNISTINSNFYGLGTTITGVLISGKHAYSFNVGDSRVYGIKKNKIKQLTKDDSLVNLLLESLFLNKPILSTKVSDYQLIKNYGLFCAKDENSVYKMMKKFLDKKIDFQTKFDYEEYNKRNLNRVINLIEGVNDNE